MKGLRRFFRRNRSDVADLSRGQRRSLRQDNAVARRRRKSARAARRMNRS